ncbi:MAG: MAPEG family protein [Pseudomonadota bacterium]
MNVAYLCIGILALMTVLLGFGVSMQRRGSRTGIGHGDDPTSALLKFGRAHGNSAEYVPLFIALIFILEMLGGGMLAHIATVGATISRIVFVIGMLSSQTLAGPNLLRFIGALGTYIFGTMLAVLVLLLAF